MGPRAERVNELEYAVFESKEAYLNFHSKFWDAHVGERDRQVFTCSCPLDCYIRDSREDKNKVERKGLDRLPNQIIGEIPGFFQPLYVVTETGGIVPVSNVRVNVRLMRTGIKPEELGVRRKKG